MARRRAADVTAILDAGFFAPGEARILRHDYGCDVLAPDRFAFARAFPTFRWTRPPSKTT